MKKLVAVLVLACSLSGCAWFQKLQSDPITALQDGVSYITTALNIAQAAFAIFASADPQHAAAVQPQFNEIVADVNHGLIVAQDGLHLAADTRGSAPDATVLLHDAQTAMSHLHDLIAGLPGTRDPASHAAIAIQQAITATARAARVPLI